MCGICGVIERPGEKLDDSLLREMNDLLRHRGPDGEGRYIEDNVGIANRRLAIIDVKGGQQPIESPDGRYRIVYNGEVYNYKELREELEKEGGSWFTNSDTEVVLRAWQVWGAEAFARFNGMFAVAIWDRRERELILARDRFGIKPLYVVNGNGRFAFASEIKALEPLTWWDRELDPFAVDEYFSYLCIPEPRTIYKNVRSLPPAHWARVKDGAITRFRYWDAKYKPRQMSLADAAAGLGEALKHSVKLSLRSDVPVGAFLSGGLDSGGVVSYAAESSDQAFDTFTVGFSNDPSYDETPDAEMVANKYGTRHHVLQMTGSSGEVPELARKAIATVDQPYADFSLLAQLQVAEFAATKVKTVLSGDGGDEVLGGYPTYYVPVFARGYQRIPGMIRDKLLLPMINSLPVSSKRISFDYVAKRFARGAVLPGDRAHFAWKEATYSENKAKLFSDQFLARCGDHDAFEPMERAFARQRQADEIHRLLYADQQTFLLNDNLPKVDRSAMSAGLEVRLPLLNNEVVDWLLQVPAELKVQPWRTKRLFRRLLSERLPKQIITGKKRGFTPPVSTWLKNELYDWSHEVLSSRALNDLDILRPGSALAYLRDHRENKSDHHRMIWCCLMLGIWAENGKLS